MEPSGPLDDLDAMDGADCAAVARAEGLPEPESVFWSEPMVTTSMECTAWNERGGGSKIKRRLQMDGSGKCIKRCGARRMRSTRLTEGVWAGPSQH